jgi:hypothetical protein
MPKMPPGSQTCPISAACAWSPEQEGPDRSDLPKRDHRHVAVGDAPNRALKIAQ